MQQPRAFPRSRALSSLCALPLCALAAWAFGQARPPHGHPAHPTAASTSRCARFALPDAEGAFLALQDRRPPTPLVDGNDLLALVNRSPRFSLGSEWVPPDLVDALTQHPLQVAECRPPTHHCLRREAARGLGHLFAAMRHAGHEPWIDSAYRSFSLQCGVFAKWAYGHHNGFCNATDFSALPGHSQHQLGTTVDLFTRAWTSGGPAFRPRFACSPGGRWIAEHSWESGYVLPYPLHPDYREAGSDCVERPDAVGHVDPRTGYKFEPWHLRYVGQEAAREFHAAWLASGPGTDAELTLEQWLRARRSEPDVVEPPVCDGCNCGACSTFARTALAAPRPTPPPDAGLDAGPDAALVTVAQAGAAVSDAGAGVLSPCGHASLWLDDTGQPLPAAGPPQLREVRVHRASDGALLVQARVLVPPQTLTQPPVVNALAPLRFHRGESSLAGVALRPAGIVHHYPPLPSAWRLGVARSNDATPPWQVALVDDARDGLANGCNSRIPATAGELIVRLSVEGVAPGSNLRVGLVHDNVRAEERALVAP